MSTQELLLDLRVLQEQPPGRIAFEYFDCIGQSELWFAIHKQMDMVWHDLHCKNVHI